MELGELGTTLECWGSWGLFGVGGTWALRGTLAICSQRHMKDVSGDMASWPGGSGLGLVGVVRALGQLKPPSMAGTLDTYMSVWGQMAHVTEECPACLESDGGLGE